MEIRNGSKLRSLFSEAMTAKQNENDAIREAFMTVQDNASWKASR